MTASSSFDITLSCYLQMSVLLSHLRITQLHWEAVTCMEEQLIAVDCKILDLMLVEKCLIVLLALNLSLLVSHQIHFASVCALITYQTVII